MLRPQWAAQKCSPPVSQKAALQLAQVPPHLPPSLHAPRGNNPDNPYQRNEHALPFASLLPPFLSSKPMQQPMQQAVTQRPPTHQCAMPRPSPSARPTTSIGTKGRSSVPSTASPSSFCREVGPGRRAGGGWPGQVCRHHAGPRRKRKPAWKAGKLVHMCPSSGPSCQAVVAAGLPASKLS